VSVSLHDAPNVPNFLNGEGKAARSVWSGCVNKRSPEVFEQRRVGFLKRILKELPASVFLHLAGKALGLLDMTMSKECQNNRNAC